MNTREIPKVIMLAGGCVSCLLSLLKHSSLRDMLIALLITLVVFYVFGLIIRAIVEKGFENVLNPKAEDEEEKDGGDEEDAENAEDAKEGGGENAEEAGDQGKGGTREAS